MRRSLLGRYHYGQREVSRALDAVVGTSPVEAPPSLRQCERIANGLRRLKCERLTRSVCSITVQRTPTLERQLEDVLAVHPGAGGIWSLTAILWNWSAARPWIQRLSLHTPCRERATYRAEVSSTATELPGTTPQDKRCARPAVLAGSGHQKGSQDQSASNACMLCVATFTKWGERLPPQSRTCLESKLAESAAKHAF